MVQRDVENVSPDKSLYASHIVIFESFVEAQNRPRGQQGISEQSDILERIIVLDQILQSGTIFVLSNEKITLLSLLVKQQEILASGRLTAVFYLLLYVFLFELRV